MSETRTNSAGAGGAAAPPAYRPSSAPNDGTADVSGQGQDRAKRSYPMPLYLHAHDNSSDRAVRSGSVIGAATPLSMEQPALRGVVSLLDMGRGGTERRVVAIEREAGATDMHEAEREAGPPLAPGVVRRSRPPPPEQPYIFLKTSQLVAARQPERQSLWADRTAGVPPPSFAMGAWPEEGEEGEGASTARKRNAAPRPSSSPHATSAGAADAAGTGTATAVPSVPGDLSSLRRLPAAPLSRGQPMGPPYMAPALALDPFMREEGYRGAPLVLSQRDPLAPPYRTPRREHFVPLRCDDSGMGDATAVPPHAEEKEDVADELVKKAPMSARAQQQQQQQQQRRRKAEASLPPSTAPAGTIVIPRRSATAAASAAPGASARRLSPQRPYTTVDEPEPEHATAPPVVDHFPSAPAAARRARRAESLSPPRAATAAAAGSVSARAAAPVAPAQSLSPRNGASAAAAPQARTAITIRPRSRPGGAIPAALSAAAAAPSPAALAARIQQAVILLSSRAPATTPRPSTAETGEAHEQEGQEEEEEAKSQAFLQPYPGNQSAVEAALRRQRRDKSRVVVVVGGDDDSSGNSDSSGEDGDGPGEQEEDGGAPTQTQLGLSTSGLDLPPDPLSLGSDHAALHAHLAHPSSILAGQIALQKLGHNLSSFQGLALQHAQGQAQSQGQGGGGPNLSVNLAVVEAWLTEMAVKFQRKVEGEQSSWNNTASGAAGAGGSVGGDSGPVGVGGGFGVMDTAGATYQSPLDRLAIGRRVLLKAGMDPLLAPRVLAGFFTYSVGMLEALSGLARHVSQRKQLVAALWRTYLSNLERCEPQLYSWVLSCVCAENARREDLRKKEHVNRARALKAHVKLLQKSVATLGAQDQSLATLASDEARSIRTLGTNLRDMQHQYELGVEHKSNVQTSIADWTIKSEPHIAATAVAEAAAADIDQTSASFEMESSVVQRQEGLVVLRATHKTLSHDIASLEQRLELLRASVAQESSKRASLSAAHTALCGEISSLEREIDSKTAQLARLADAALVAQRQIQEEEARERELHDIIQAQETYMQQLCANGLHADLAPEAQADALRSAMVQSAKRRSNRSTAVPDEDNDNAASASRFRGLHSQLEARAQASAPLPSFDPSTPPPDFLAHGDQTGAQSESDSGMARRDLHLQLHTQQVEMKKLKAESERKIEQFEQQQQLLRGEIEADRARLSQADAGVVQSRLQHGVLTDRRDLRLQALRSLQARHAELVGPVASKLRAQSLAIEGALSAHHLELEKRRRLLAEKKATLAGLLDKISDLSKLEEIRNEQLAALQAEQSELNNQRTELENVVSTLAQSLAKKSRHLELLEEASRPQTTSLTGRVDILARELQLHEQERGVHEMLMHGERRATRAKEEALAAAVARAAQEREKHQRVVDQTASLNQQISADDTLCAQHRDSIGTVQSLRDMELRERGRYADLAAHELEEMAQAREKALASLAQETRVNEEAQAELNAGRNLNAQLEATHLVRVGDCEAALRLKRVEAAEARRLLDAQRAAVDTMSYALGAQMASVEAALKESEERNAQLAAQLLQEQTDAEEAVALQQVRHKEIEAEAIVAVELQQLQPYLQAQLEHIAAQRLAGERAVEARLNTELSLQQELLLDLSLHEQAQVERDMRAVERACQVGEGAPEELYRAAMAQVDEEDLEDQQAQQQQRERSRILRVSQRVVEEAKRISMTSPRSSRPGSSRSRRTTGAGAEPRTIVPTQFRVPSGSRSSSRSPTRSRSRSGSRPSSSTGVRFAHAVPPSHARDGGGDDSVATANLHLSRALRSQAAYALAHPHADVSNRHPSGAESAPRGSPDPSGAYARHGAAHQAGAAAQQRPSSSHVRAPAGSPSALENASLSSPPMHRSRSDTLIADPRLRAHVLLEEHEHEQGHDEQDQIDEDESDGSSGEDEQVESAAAVAPDFYTVSTELAVPPSGSSIGGAGGPNSEVDPFEYTVVSEGEELLVTQGDELVEEQPEPDEDNDGGASMTREALRRFIRRPSGKRTRSSPVVKHSASQPQDQERERSAGTSPAPALVRPSSTHIRVTRFDARFFTPDAMSPPHQQQKHGSGVPSKNAPGSLLYGEHPAIEMTSRRQQEQTQASRAANGASAAASTPTSPQQQRPQAQAHGVEPEGSVLEPLMRRIRLMPAPPPAPTGAGADGGAGGSETAPGTAAASPSSPPPLKPYYIVAVDPARSERSKQRRLRRKESNKNKNRKEKDNKDKDKDREKEKEKKAFSENMRAMHGLRLGPSSRRSYQASSSGASVTTANVGASSASSSASAAAGASAARDDASYASGGGGSSGVLIPERVRPNNGHIAGFREQAAQARLNLKLITWRERREERQERRVERSHRRAERARLNGGSALPLTPGESSASSPEPTLSSSASEEDGEGEDAAAVAEIDRAFHSILNPSWKQAFAPAAVMRQRNRSMRLSVGGFGFGMGGGGDEDEEEEDEFLSAHSRRTSSITIPAVRAVLDAAAAADAALKAKAAAKERARLERARRKAMEDEEEEESSNNTQRPGGPLLQLEEDEAQSDDEATAFYPDGAAAPSIVISPASSPRAWAIAAGKTAQPAASPKNASAATAAAQDQSQPQAPGSASGKHKRLASGPVRSKPSGSPSKAASGDGGDAAGGGDAAPATSTSGALPKPVRRHARGPSVLGLSATSDPSRRGLDQGLKARVGTSAPGTALHPTHVRHRSSSSGSGAQGGSVVANALNAAKKLRDKVASITLPTGAAAAMAAHKKRQEQVQHRRADSRSGGHGRKPSSSSSFGGGQHVRSGSVSGGPAGRGNTVAPAGAPPARRGRQTSRGSIGDSSSLAGRSGGGGGVSVGNRSATPDSEREELERITTLVDPLQIQRAKEAAAEKRLERIVAADAARRAREAEAQQGDDDYAYDGGSRSASDDDALAEQSGEEEDAEDEYAEDADEASSPVVLAALVYSSDEEGQGQEERGGQAGADTIESAGNAPHLLAPPQRGILRAQTHHRRKSSLQASSPRAAAAAAAATASRSSVLEDVAELPPLPSVPSQQDEDDTTSISRARTVQFAQSGSGSSSPVPPPSDVPSSFRMDLLTPRSVQAALVRAAAVVAATASPRTAQGRTGGHMGAGPPSRQRSVTTAGASSRSPPAVTVRRALGSAAASGAAPSHLPLSRVEAYASMMLSAKVAAAPAAASLPRDGESNALRARVSSAAAGVGIVRASSLRSPATSPGRTSRRSSMVSSTGAAAAATAAAGAAATPVSFPPLGPHAQQQQQPQRLLPRHDLDVVGAEPTSPVHTVAGPSPSALILFDESFFVRTHTQAVVEAAREAAMAVAGPTTGDVSGPTPFPPASSAPSRPRSRARSRATSRAASRAVSRSPSRTDLHSDPEDALAYGIASAAAQSGEPHPGHWASARMPVRRIASTSPPRMPRHHSWAGTAAAATGAPASEASPEREGVVRRVSRSRGSVGPHAPVRDGDMHWPTTTTTVTRGRPPGGFSRAFGESSAVGSRWFAHLGSAAVTAATVVAGSQSARRASGGDGHVQAQVAGAQTARHTHAHPHAHAHAPPLSRPASSWQSAGANPRPPVPPSGAAPAAPAAPSRPRTGGSTMPARVAAGASTVSPAASSPAPPLHRVPDFIKRSAYGRGAAP